jgi:hypothetical protein
MLKDIINQGPMNIKRQKLPILMNAQNKIRYRQICKIYAISMSFQGLSLTLFFDRAKDGFSHQSDAFLGV